MSFTIRRGGGGQAIVHGTSDKFLNAKIKNRTLDTKLQELEKQIDKRKENELRILKREQDIIAADQHQTRQYIDSNIYTRAGLNPSYSFNSKSHRKSKKSKTHVPEKDAVEEALNLLAYRTRRRSSSAGATDMPTKSPTRTTEPIRSDRTCMTPDHDLDGVISKLAYRSHRRSSSVGDIDVSLITINPAIVSKEEPHNKEETPMENTFDSLMKQARYRSRRRTSSAGAADMIRPKLERTGKDVNEISLNLIRSKHTPISETNETVESEDDLDPAEELERFQNLRCCLRRKSKSLNDISIHGLNQAHKSDTKTGDVDSLDQLLNEARRRVKNYQHSYKERFGVMTTIQAFHEETSDIQSEIRNETPTSHEITHNVAPPKKNLPRQEFPKNDDVDPYDLIVEQSEKDAAKLRYMTRSDQQRHTRDKPFQDVVKSVVYQ